MRIAGDFLGDDDFVMYLGDNMLQQGLAEFVEHFESARARDGADAPDGADPARARRGPDAVRRRRGERGRRGAATWSRSRPTRRRTSRSSGVYLFDAEIHRAVASIEPSARGELEITDAIQWLLEHGKRVRHEVLRGWWIDTGKKDPLLDCNRLVLETIESRNDGKVDEASTHRGERRHRSRRRRS